MARIFSLAMHYSLEKRLIDQLNALDPNSNGGADIRALLTELAVRLEDTWAITSEQKVSILQVWLRSDSQVFCRETFVHCVKNRYTWPAGRTSRHYLWMSM